MKRPLRRAGLAVLLYASLHAGLSAILFIDGHRPTFGALSESHYLLQAILLFPMSAVAWLAFGATHHAIARPGRARMETVAAMGPAVFLPLALLYVLPDLVGYTIGGFAALAPTARIFAPIALSVAIIGAVRSGGDASFGRRISATCVGFVAFALVMTPWLR